MYSPFSLVFQANEKHKNFQFSEFFRTNQLTNCFKNGAKYHRETRLERIRLHVLFVAWM